MNDPLNTFLNEMQSNIAKITEKTNSMCAQLDKMEERFLNTEIKLEANKLVNHEKNENSNYKFSVLEEKINNNNQKVSDLNNIMMKHFAYKNNKSSIPQSGIPQSSIPPSNIPSSILPQSGIPQSNNTVPNPFAMPGFGAK